MKKLFIITLILVVSNLVAKPKIIKSLRLEQHENGWYEDQAEKWKKEVNKNPENPDNWYNYLRALRYVTNRNYSGFDNMDKIKFLQNKVKESQKYIGNSWQFYHLKYIFNKKDNKQLLKKIHKMKPDNSSINLDLLTMAEKALDREKRKKWSEYVYKIGIFHDNLLEMGYNLLQSIEPNGILFVNGDNDTFPLWILQDVFDLRNDVSIINFGLAHSKSYLSKLIKEENLKFKNFEKWFDPGLNSELFLKDILDNNPERVVYFSHTCQQKFIKYFERNLYNTGLVSRYSEERLDNVALLKRNFNKRFHLDYLTSQWSSKSAPYSVLAINNNYFAGIFILIEHYITGEQLGKARYWINFGKRVIVKNSRQKKAITGYLTSLEKKLDE